MVQRTLLNLLRLLGTEHQWCEDPIESACLLGPSTNGARTLLYLCCLLGPSTDGAEDPIESAPFIIILLGTEQRWCRGPY